MSTPTTTDWRDFDDRDAQQQPRADMSRPALPQLGNVVKALDS